MKFPLRITQKKLFLPHIFKACPHLGNKWATKKYKHGNEGIFHTGRKEAFRLEVQRVTEASPFLFRAGRCPQNEGVDETGSCP